MIKRTLALLAVSIAAGVADINAAPIRVLFLGFDTANDIAPVYADIMGSGDVRFDLANSSFLQREPYALTPSHLQGYDSVLVDKQCAEHKCQQYTGRLR
jgi:hypothetical protein